MKRFTYYPQFVLGLAFNWGWDTLTATHSNKTHDAGRCLVGLQCSDSVIGLFVSHYTVPASPGQWSMTQSTLTRCGVLKSVYLCKAHFFSSGQVRWRDHWDEVNSNQVWRSDWPLPVLLCHDHADEPCLLWISDWTDLALLSFTGCVLGWLKNSSSQLMHRRSWGSSSTPTSKACWTRTS